ncbi:hypothetical protein BVG16_16445 [Paenibacillus selenitireducens]|uniref:Uncharacterized protein n=1 Tax=Paenibacillus selenitireducens TaxID=1324314 RepID=A0A1T2XA29_9BACL|nr:hypothetical protein [Paenibacillus selenitireducens]OPA76759.1 hypothetical protein BVG16_16445 [Paenibacillus selenitireducens]
MNKHDQQRKDALIKTLLKAKEQAETAHLYLSVLGQDPEEIADTIFALEHIEIVLEQLNKSQLVGAID